MTDIAKTAEQLAGLGFYQFATSRDLGRGTTFPATGDIPGGLQAGDRFFRTDLGWICYYSTAISQWVSENEPAIVLPSSDNSTAFSTRSTTGIAQYARIRIDYAPYVTRIAISQFVPGTNNASNYWTVRLQGVNSNFTAGTDILSYTTAADGTGWVDHETNASTPAPSNRYFFALRTEKTLGAPGDITILATVYYRYIVT